ncbi:MAG: PhzF family phenazine biosynthesis protein [candidate division NC10 bacterium]|nr:PhzF family phenazine biosynthesis protein [candidate division NC10 bacterium]
MKITFEQVDVFTDRPFAGNPLCVVPDGAGLSTEQMQAIAKEMNLSETTFVLPPTDPQAAYWMRIFTPAKEIPFAGHPSVGTAYVMACAGRFPLQEPVTRIFQQVGIGTLPLDIEVTDGKPGRVVMTQGAPSFGAVLRDLTPFADALGLDPLILARAKLPIQVVSTGLEHLMVPLPDLEAMGGLQPNFSALDVVLRDRGALGCFVFTLETISSDAFAHARMFAPGAGISEDPATGSAAGPLGAYLAIHGALPGKQTSFVIEQGVEMGRPSRIWVEVGRDAAGMPNMIRVGGTTVPVIRGTIQV